MPAKRKKTTENSAALVPSAKQPNLAGYQEFLGALKARIHTAQLRAASTVNQELVLLYWQIGRDILSRQQQQGWGAKVIDRLSTDLRHTFPEMKGFSPRNLKYMRTFAEAWPDEEFVQQAAAQIPWFHNCLILDKLADDAERVWYVQKTIENGWSRNILALQIESNLYQRQGKALNNFSRTLPPPQSDLAQQLLKDPYNFDFLTLGTQAHERDLERGLLNHVKDFLLELGKGFAFVGSQYRLDVGGEDFFLDLLFYQLQLRCFLVIDLKWRGFKPADTGQMNFYLSAVDDLLRRTGDQPSIGLILCKNKNKIVAEYALRDTNKPIGISEFRLTEMLPENLKSSLPTIEELEEELSAVAAEASESTAQN